MRDFPRVFPLIITITISLNDNKAVKYTQIQQKGRQRSRLKRRNRDDSTEH